MANPFIAGPIAQTAKSYTANLPELQELAWDFIHDTFIHDNDGRLKTVTGNEALKVWIYKALKTERYRYMAYLHGDYNAEGNYGVELERFIGTRSNSEISATEIKRYIKDGLLVNPYIKSVDAIETTVRNGENLTLTVNLTSVYGSTSITVGGE